jgi:hypothetical protein
MLQSTNAGGGCGPTRRCSGVTGSGRFWLLEAVKRPFRSIERVPSSHPLNAKPLGRSPRLIAQHVHATMTLIVTNRFDRSRGACPMHFVLIFGPPAVGKMTVGTALADLTGLKLFHNHMTIDLVLHFFPFGHPKFGQLVGEFRRRIFEEVASSDLLGLIFTYVWALDQPADKEEIDSYTQIFRQQEAAIYFVELEADQTERLKRNTTAFRLAHKASKRDIARSESHLLDADRRYRLNSNNDFFYTENYIKINNTALSAMETAQHIVETFGFPAIQHRSA